MRQIREARFNFMLSCGTIWLPGPHHNGGRGRYGSGIVVLSTSENRLTDGTTHAIRSRAIVQAFKGILSSQLAVLFSGTWLYSDIVCM